MVLFTPGFSLVPTSVNVLGLLPDIKIKAVASVPKLSHQLNAKSMIGFLLKAKPKAVGLLLEPKHLSKLGLLYDVLANP